MIFKAYTFSLIWRTLLIWAFGSAAIYFGVEKNWALLILLLICSLVFVGNLINFIKRRFRYVNDFFEAVKYRDFSRLYAEEGKSADVKSLFQGFNLVNHTIRQMNTERELQYLYLQKILEMVDVGILAYETQTGEVIWMNDSFRELTDCPTFKNIKFFKSRNEALHRQLFEQKYQKPTAIDLSVKKETLKVLVSESNFRLKESTGRLMVINNIEATVNKTESEAWKKLLSVMTHEIMNSIAPIHSLSGTLHGLVADGGTLIKEDSSILEDLASGLSSIEKRSLGLMQFAKTYRSLNKVSQLNLEQTKLKTLFSSIETLIAPNLKGVDLKFELQRENLELNIDPHLIEQVLINLILNGAEACQGQQNAKVLVKAQRNEVGEVSILVADNGSGIPVEILDQIFVPFYSTKKRGSGIGLSLCRQIMTLHGGKIQVQSERPGSTVFTLKFSGVN
jgi:signal transduction histidine kinase